MKRYREKPVEVCAAQMTREVLMGYRGGIPGLDVIADTPPGAIQPFMWFIVEGTRGYEGDYLVKGADGTLAACPRDIFEAKYEEVVP